MLTEVCSWKDCHRITGLWEAFPHHTHTAPITEGLFSAALFPWHIMPDSQEEMTSMPKARQQRQHPVGETAGVRTRHAGDAGMIGLETENDCDSYAEDSHDDVDSMRGQTGRTRREGKPGKNRKEARVRQPRSPHRHEEWLCRAGQWMEGGRAKQSGVSSRCTAVGSEGPWERGCSERPRS